MGIIMKQVIMLHFWKIAKMRKTPNSGHKPVGYLPHEQLLSHVIPTLISSSGARWSYTNLCFPCSLSRQGQVRLEWWFVIHLAILRA